MGEQAKWYQFPIPRNKRATVAVLDGMVYSLIYGESPRGHAHHLYIGTVCYYHAVPIQVSGCYLLSGLSGNRYLPKHLEFHGYATITEGVLHE